MLCGRDLLSSLRHTVRLGRHLNPRILLQVQGYHFGPSCVTIVSWRALVSWRAFRTYCEKGSTHLYAVRGGCRLRPITGASGSHIRLSTLLPHGAGADARPASRDAGAQGPPG